MWRFEEWFSVVFKQWILTQQLNQVVDADRRMDRRRAGTSFFHRPEFASQFSKKDSCRSRVICDQYVYNFDGPNTRMVQFTSILLPIFHKIN